MKKFAVILAVIFAITLVGSGLWPFPNFGSTYLGTPESITIRGGIGDFYLGRFLDLNGMSLQDVTLVNINPSQSISALTNGSIDAAMVFNIDVDKLSGNIVI